MTLAEKRNFILNHLHYANEKVINELYEVLHRSEVLKAKLVSRSEKSEHDIKKGKIFSRAEVENKTFNTKK